MDNTMLELNSLDAAIDQSAQSQIGELNELHLAMIGGGCAEVCPY